MVLFAAYFIICDHLSVSIIIAGYMIAIFSIVMDFAVIIVIDNMNERISTEEVKKLIRKMKDRLEEAM